MNKILIYALSGVMWGLVAIAVDIVTEGRYGWGLAFLIITIGFLFTIILIEVSKGKKDSDYIV